MHAAKEVGMLGGGGPAETRPTTLDALSRTPSTLQAGDNMDYHSDNFRRR